MGAAGVERVDEPRPGDVGDERVEADVGLERSLREADDAESAAPGIGLRGVVEQHEATGAEVGVVGVPRGVTSAVSATANGASPAGAGISEIVSSGRGDGRTQRIECGLELRGRLGRRVGHDCRLESRMGRMAAARRTARDGFAGRARMGRRNGRAGVIGIAAGAVGLLLAAVGAGIAVITVIFARRVVTPPTTQDEGERIVSVDRARGELVLATSEPALWRGRYGFWFSGDAGYARLGDVIDEGERTVRRRIERVDFGRIERASRGRVSGWYHLGPWELALPYENVLVETSLGPAPAWLIRSAQESTRWVVQVHGRGAKRQEGLRAVAPAAEAGWNSLLISYRNDTEAPESEDRRYGLGGTEWADVVEAVRFAVAHGADEIVLMGWSMGGMISLQAVLRSAEVREHLVGLILESPVIDWVDILRFQGRALGMPSELGDAVSRLLSGPLSGGLTGIAAPIDLDELDPVARAAEFEVPILLMHSVDDGFVPIDGSRRFAASRPDLIEFEVFEGARHTKLWNHDPERWTGLVGGWLVRRAEGVDRLGEEAEIIG